MIKVLSTIESNPFYDINRSNNGGGYSHPEITFEYNGITGVYHDTSCGDFGERYKIEWNGKSFELDEVQRGTHPEKNYFYNSSFTEKDREFINEFSKKFGKKIWTVDEVAEWDEYIWGKYSR